MLLSEADFHTVASVGEASDLLVRYGPQARLLAGGTDLLVDVKRSRFNARHVVYINGIDALRGITPTPGGLRIGALSTVSDLMNDATVRERFPAILDAARKMAGPQVRNMATVGGNICNANHCADLPPVLMVLGAQLTLHSRAGERVVPLRSFFTGSKRTALKIGELLTEIFIPYPAARSGTAFARFSLRESNAIAVAGVAAMVELDTERCVRAASISLSAVAPTTIMVEEAASMLTGRPLDEASVRAAASAAMQASHAISDLRAQEDYRRWLVESLTRTAINSAAARIPAE